MWNWMNDDPFEIVLEIDLVGNKNMLPTLQLSLR